jgi:hypothetical protein
MLRIIAFATCLLPALLAAPRASAQDSLSHRELMGLFPGNFVAFVKGHVVHIVADMDGRIVATDHGFSDTGRWSLQNGQLCIAMDSLTRGRATCSAVYTDSGWYFGSGVWFRRS